MNQTQCTNCFQSYEDYRSPPDLSLHRSVSYYQCPNCWAKTLAWDDGLDVVEQKVYLPEKRALISDWNKRWAILTDLLIQIFTSPEPPGESLELQYLNLHFWFIEHQYEFLQVFADLYEGQAVVTDAYTNSEDSPDNIESAEIEEHHWNPYQWYYREMDLYNVAQENHLMISIDPWIPNRAEIGNMKFDFAVTKAMLGKLVNWVMV